MFGTNAVIGDEAFHVESLSVEQRINHCLSATVVLDGVPASIDVGATVEIRFADESVLRFLCRSYRQLDENRLRIDATDYPGRLPHIDFAATAEPNADSSCRDFLKRHVNLDWRNVEPVCAANWLAVDVSAIELINAVAHLHDCFWYSDHEQVMFSDTAPGSADPVDVVTRQLHSSGELWEVDAAFVRAGQWLESEQGPVCVLQSNTNVRNQSHACSVVVGTPAAPSREPLRGEQWRSASIDKLESLTVRLADDPKDALRAAWLEPGLSQFSIEMPQTVSDSVMAAVPLGVSNSLICVLPFTAGVVHEKLRLRATDATACYQSLRTEIAGTQEIECPSIALKTNSLDVMEC